MTAGRVELDADVVAHLLVLADLIDDQTRTEAAAVSTARQALRQLEQVDR